MLTSRGALVGGSIGSVVGYGIHAAIGAISGSLPALSAASNAISKIGANTQHHIMQQKHAWDKVISNVSFENVKSLIQQVMNSGTTTLTGKYGESLVYSAEKVINGATVRVTYAVNNGITTISNAYVVNK